MRRFEILHNGVDDWKRGDVVTETEFEEKKTDVARLLKLEAIREVEELTPQPLGDRIRNAVGDGIGSDAKEQKSEEVEDLESGKGPKAASASSERAPSNLDGMTVATLRQMAEGYDISGTSGMNKAELIEAIEKAQQQGSGQES